MKKKIALTKSENLISINETSIKIVHATFEEQIWAIVGQVDCSSA